MGTFIAALGQQAAGQAAGGAVAMGLQRIGANYDRKQMMKSQTALQNLQITGNEELMKYQQMLEQQNWENTNYPAQIEQMKKAGVNPALLYGGGGGGGATMGSVGSGGVQSGQGLDPNTRAGAGMGIQNGMMAAQMQLMTSQAKNLDANTQKTTAEIPNVGKTGENIEASTKSLLAGITNTQAQTALTRADTRIKEIQGNVQEETQDAQIKTIGANSSKAIDEAISALNQAKVDQQTVDAKVLLLKATAIGQVLENVLTRAKTANTEQQTETEKQRPNLVFQQSQSEVAKRLQGWQGLDLEHTQQEIQKWLGQANLDQNEMRIATEAITGIIHGAAHVNQGIKVQDAPRGKVGFKQ